MFVSINDSDQLSVRTMLEWWTLDSSLTAVEDIFTIILP